MTTRLASLEAALARLADVFANQLARAVLRAPPAELREVLTGGLQLDRALAAAAANLARAGRAANLPHPGRPSRRVAPPVSHLEAPRRRGRPSRTSLDAAPEDAAFEHAITDPSLLLGVIGAATAVVARESRASSTLLTAPTPGQADAQGHGPTLRPGERLQRTTGGNVVLRRGGK
jgi:hypothetical protein